jgi:hypothetical protein
MRRNRVPLLFLVLCFSAPHLRADIAAIQASALPQETPILAALDDTKQLEPYSRSYTADPQWSFPLKKSEVAARLGKDLGFLTLALRNHSDNSELALLTGLVAHYAYNVDVPGSLDDAIGAFDRAAKLAPADVRGPWFHASLMCQTMKSDVGAGEFLSIESSHAWDQLPVAFWDDYLECAAITNMPAHLLRAADHLEKLHAPEADMFPSVIEATRKRYVPYDPNKKYEPHDVWQAVSQGGDTVFTSTTCGVRFHAHSDWRVNQMALTNGSCVAYFSTGPYKAITDSLHPSILVLVQQPQGNETLEQFSKRFTTDGTFTPDADLHCPAPDCIALKAMQPGMYKADGDGHGRVILFGRDQPDVPGLIFESPEGPPKAESGNGPVAYRPNQIQQRIRGKLYYLVLLDAAASIEVPSLKDYEFFLANLTAE